MTSPLSTAPASKPGLRVRFRFFARYAELLGESNTTLELMRPSTVADAVHALRSTHRSGSLLPERPLVALNQQHVLADHPVEDGDELALLPPLAGG